MEFWITRILSIICTFTFNTRMFWCQTFSAQFHSLKEQHKQVYFPNIFHRPYTQLTQDKVQARKIEIRNIASQALFKEAARKTKEFIEVTMQGIEYYQRYQKNILLFLIRVAFVGCAFINFSKLCSNGRKTNSVMRRHSATLYTIFRNVIIN